jgi:hypothetical protein
MGFDERESVECRKCRLLRRHLQQLVEQSGGVCPGKSLSSALRSTGPQIEHDKALRTLEWKPKAEGKLSMTRVRNPDDVWQLVCLLKL